jgi:hypothetical protein
VNTPARTDAERTRLLRRGFALEYATLGCDILVYHAIRETRAVITGHHGTGRPPGCGTS